MTAKEIKKKNNYKLLPIETLINIEDLNICNNCKFLVMIFNQSFGIHIDSKQHYPISKYRNLRYRCARIGVKIKKEYEVKQWGSCDNFKKRREN